MENRANVGKGMQKCIFYKKKVLMSTRKLPCVINMGTRKLPCVPAQSQVQERQRPSRATDVWRVRDNNVVKLSTVIISVVLIFFSTYLPEAFVQYEEE